MLSKFFLLRIAGVLICLSLAMTIKVSAFCCSDIKEKDWFGTKLVTCYVTSNTINDPDCTTVRTDIKAFSVEGQRGITALPIDISKRFPNLEIYDAGSCSITSVSKANFAKLSKLRKLWLGFNQITAIAVDVFEDLTSLDYLAIGKPLKLTNFQHIYISSLFAFRF